VHPRLEMDFKRDFKEIAEEIDDDFGIEECIRRATTVSRSLIRIPNEITELTGSTEAAEPTKVSPAASKIPQIPIQVITFSFGDSVSVAPSSPASSSSPPSSPTLSYPKPTVYHLFNAKSLIDVLAYKQSAAKRKLLLKSVPKNFKRIADEISSVVERFKRNSYEKYFTVFLNTNGFLYLLLSNNLSIDKRLRLILVRFVQRLSSCDSTNLAPPTLLSEAIQEQLRLTRIIHERECEDWKRQLQDVASTRHVMREKVDNLFHKKRRLTIAFRRAREETRLANRRARAAESLVKAEREIVRNLNGVIRETTERYFGPSPETMPVKKLEPQMSVILYVGTLMVPQISGGGYESLEKLPHPCFVCLGGKLSRVNFLLGELYKRYLPIGLYTEYLSKNRELSEILELIRQGSLKLDTAFLGHSDRSKGLPLRFCKVNEKILEIDDASGGPSTSTEQSEPKEAEQHYVGHRRLSIPVDRRLFTMMCRYPAKWDESFPNKFETFPLRPFSTYVYPNVYVSKHADADVDSAFQAVVDFLKPLWLSAPSIQTSLLYADCSEDEDCDFSGKEEMIESDDDDYDLTGTAYHFGMWENSDMSDLEESAAKSNERDVEMREN
jgi:hypothetical protein